MASIAIDQPTIIDKLFKKPCLHFYNASRKERFLPVTQPRSFQELAVRKGHDTEHRIMMMLAEGGYVALDQVRTPKGGIRSDGKIGDSFLEIKSFCADLGNESAKYLFESRLHFHYSRKGLKVLAIVCPTTKVRVKMSLRYMTEREFIRAGYDVEEFRSYLMDYRTENPGESSIEVLFIWELRDKIKAGESIG